MPSLSNLKQTLSSPHAVVVVGGGTKERNPPPSLDRLGAILELFSREPIDRLASCCALYFAPLKMFEALLLQEY